VRRWGPTGPVIVAAALLLGTAGCGAPSDDGAAPSPTTTTTSANPSGSASPSPRPPASPTTAAPTPTPTATSTPTPTPKPTPSPTKSPTPTPTPTKSPTKSPTPTPTKSPTPSPKPTPTPTTTPTPTSTVPAALAGRVVTTLPTTQRIVALTFDGGASDTGVPSILGTLADTGVRATFFVTGDFVARYPARVRAMAAAGHRVANHSATHPDFATLTAAEMRDQLARAEAAIAPIAGRTTRPWFRFPFGSSPAAAITTVNAGGYAAIGWTVDTLGWQGTTEGRSVASVVARVLGAARPGEIVLLHVGAHPEDGSTLDADALPTIIAELRAAGYRFVAMDAILG
jgi:peptidoglycan/xylan/chitin deacetylase (PgdA/CDA1 family)